MKRVNLIEQMANHLEFLGLGLCATEEQDGNIFWGHLPDKPDCAICIFSTDTGFSGRKDGARIQIYTRGGVGDTQWPYEMACRITEELEGFIGFMAGDGVSVRMETVNSAQGLGTDTRGRELYSSNYLIYYCDF